MSPSTDRPPGQPPGQVPRPRQVTLAASLVMAASVMLVVSVFERLAGLRSLESRTSVQHFISEPPGSQLGIGLESALTIMRTVSMVGAGLATAAAILGWHVLKRSRSARAGLTALALPLFVCGLIAGGFLASVVAASVAMLWLAPSRHWFAGTTPATGPGSPEGSSQRSAGASGGGPPREWPPPLPPPGPPATQQPPPWPSYAGQPTWTVPPPGSAPAARPPRPGAVVAACVLTWACCAFAALLSVLLVAVLSFDSEGLFAEMHRQNPHLADDGVTAATLHSATWATAIVCLVWAVVSGVLAVLAFNRVRWAAIALVVSTGAVALLCLAGSLLSPVLAVPGILAAATAGLLLQPSSQRWLVRSGAPARRP